VRRAELLLYVLIVVGEGAWAAFVPLGPVYEDRFDLSATETGVLLGAASIAILLVSPPAGVLADRFGARRLTIGGTLLMSVATIAQGVAPHYATLLVGRVAFGLGFGVLWSAGLALLTQVVPPARRPGALALTMTLAAVGTMIGPGYSGLLVEPLGTGWTFGLAGAVCLVAALGLAFTPATREAHEARHHTPVGQTARRMVREPLVLGGLVCIALPGLVNNGVNLLVPLQLDDNGTSTAVVGACFSASALIFAAGSFGFARSGARFATLRVGAVGSLVLAAVLFIPLLTTASAALLAFIVVRSFANTGLFPLAMPLAVEGAERAGIGRGAVLGIVNASWALAATLGPIVAGVIADAAGARTAYAGGIVLGVVAAVWLARADRRVAVTS
jgi:MFS family permease